MATDVGSIFLEVFADTKALKAQVKRAAKQAGKDFGKDFGDNANDSMAPGLSEMSRRIHKTLGRDNGKMTGKQFADGLGDGVKESNLDFDRSILRSFKKGDWNDLISEFGSLEDASKAVNDRLREMGKSGFNKDLKPLGVTVDNIRQQFKAATKEIEKQLRTEQEAREATEALTEAKKKQREEEKALAAQMRAAEKEERAALRERERQQREQAKAEKEATREREAAIREQEKVEARLRKQMENDAARKERERLNQAIRESSSLTKDLDHDFRSLNKTVRGNEQAMQKLRQSVTSKKDIKRVEELNAEHERTSNLLNKIQRDHDVAIARMVKGSDEYNAQITKTKTLLKGVGDDVDNFSKRKIKVKVDVDTPGRGPMTIAGFRDGQAYEHGFNTATRDVGRGIFTRLSDGWKTFTKAFPAEITILMNGILLLGGPIATLGSGIAAIGTALAGSLTIGLAAAAAAAGGLFAAVAYGVALATKSFEIFEKRFPATQAALDNLKTSFEKVDLPTFAKEWSGSLADFANTLADSLRFDTVAENLGKATAKITDAFTVVLRGEPWAEFVDAIEGPISRALASFGTGLASGFDILLQFMTSAAPLAEHLGEQFAVWTKHWDKFWNTDQGQRDMLHFMEQATEALDILFPLIANVGEALTNTLLIGSEAGNGMLGVLGDLAKDWAEWTKSIEGEGALRQWFLAGREIFDALGPLITGVAQMFQNMVTPASIRNLTGFMDGLASLLPVLGDVFAVVEEVGVWAALGEALKAIANAVRPLIEPLKRIGAAIGGVLMSAVKALTPILERLGRALGRALDALAPWIEALGQALEGIMEFDSTKMTAGFAKLEQTAGPAIEGLATLILEVLGDVLPTLIEQFAEILPTILPMLVEAIASIGTALANSLSLLIPQLVLVASEIIVALLGAFVQVMPALLTGLVTLLGTLSTAMVEAMPTVVQAFSDILPQLVQIMTDSGPEMIEGWTTMFIAGVEAISIALPSITQALKDMMPEISLALEELIPDLIDAGVVLFISLTDAVTESAPEIASSLSVLLPAIAAALVEMSPTLITMAVQFFLLMVQALPTIMPEITKAMEDISPAIQQAMVTLTPVMLQAGKDLIKGLIMGIWEMRPQWLKDIGSIISSGIQKAKDLLGEKSPSKVFKEIGVNVVKGLVIGLDDGRDEARRSVERLIEEVKKGVGNPNESALIQYIKDVGAQLDSVWKHYDQVSEKLDNANKDLKKQIDARADMVRSVRSSVMGELDLSSAIVRSRSGKILEGKTTAAGIGAVVAQMRAKAKVFNQKMRWLIGKGFSPAFVQMIAGYGMDEAIAIAKALQSGTAEERTQIKEDFAAFTNSATSVGNALAGQMFDAGINSTKALIAGLVDEKAELKKAAEEIAKTLVDEIKRQLGIKSPSTVFMGIGENLMVGLNIGLTDGSRDVLNTVKSITDDVQAAFAPNVTSAAYGVNPAGSGGNGAVPASTTSAGTTVASGAIQIVTPVKDPAIVASMVLDGLVSKAI